MTTETSTTDRTGGLQKTAQELASEVGQTAERQADTVMDRAGTTVRDVAESIRSASADLGQRQPHVARWGDMAADRLEDAAGFLEQHEPREVLDEAQRVARQQPALVVAGGLIVGLALGRLLRTASEGGQQSSQDWYRQGFQGGTGNGSSRSMTNGSGMETDGATAGYQP
jgi:ElaB/YqjD/DUF883 family membrane-anchored ribosome-binding protein